MARTSIYMNAAERRAWAAEYDRKKKAGAKVRRVGGMEMIQDDYGCWYQRNGDACPGKGYDAQAQDDATGHVHRRYRQPPAHAGNPKGQRTRSPRWWDAR
jgi:hypothetical protein